MTKARYMKLSERIDIWSKTLQRNLLLIYKTYFLGKFSLTHQSKHREISTLYTRTNHWYHVLRNKLWYFVCNENYEFHICPQAFSCEVIPPFVIFLATALGSTCFSWSTLYFMIQSRLFLSGQYERKQIKPWSPFMIPLLKMTVTGCSKWKNFKQN